MKSVVSQTVSIVLWLKILLASLILHVKLVSWNISYIPSCIFSMGTHLTFWCCGRAEIAQGNIRLYTRLIFHQEKLTQWPFVGISPDSCWRRVHWDDVGTWDRKGSSMACRSSLFLLYIATRGPGTWQATKASLKPLQLMPGIGRMFARLWAQKAHGLVRFPQRSSHPMPQGNVVCSRSLLCKALVVWLVCY